MTFKAAFWNHINRTIIAHMRMGLFKRLKIQKLNVGWRQYARNYLLHFPIRVINFSPHV